MYKCNQERMLDAYIPFVFTSEAVIPNIRGTLEVPEFNSL
jgi:hypothetical protein